VRAVITTFVQSEYFTVYKWDVHEQLELEQDKPFMLVSVIVEEETIGGGRRGECSIRKEGHFILGTFQIKGVVSHPKTTKGGQKDDI
jgi:mannose-6-phosphate isomerase